MWVKMYSWLEGEKQRHSQSRWDEVKNEVTCSASKHEIPAKNTQNQAPAAQTSLQ